MKKFDIEDINLKELTYEDYIEMPMHIRTAISKKMAQNEYDEIRKKVDYEPRDWSKNIDKVWVSGMDVTHYNIGHLKVVIDENSISIIAWVSGYSYTVEVFKTKEKLDSFINALMNARDAVFGA